MSTPYDNAINSSQLALNSVASSSVINHVLKNDHLLNDEEYQKYLYYTALENIKDCMLVQDVAQILVFGAKKYAPNSWKTHNKDFLGACLRHIFAHKDAIELKDDNKLIDKESGRLHIDHAICNLMFLKWQIIQTDIKQCARGII